MGNAKCPPLMSRNLEITEAKLFPITLVMVMILNHHAVKPVPALFVLFALVVVSRFDQAVIISACLAWPLRVVFILQRMLFEKIAAYIA